MDRSTYVRVVAGWLLGLTCILNTSLHGMDKVIEDHPLHHPDVRKAFAEGQTLLADVRTNFEQGPEWLTYNNEHGTRLSVNKKCGLGLLDLVNDKRSQGVAFLEQAAGQGSSWANFYLGFLNLMQEPSRDTAKAFNYFDQAESSSNGPFADYDWYNHIMVTAGMAPQYAHREKMNNVALLDKLLCVGASRGNLAYPLSMYARKRGDEIGERLALEHAIKHNNMYRLRALNDYGAFLLHNNEAQAALPYLNEAASLGSEHAVENARNAREWLAEQEALAAQEQAALAAQQAAQDAANIAYSEPSTNSDTDDATRTPEQKEQSIVPVVSRPASPSGSSASSIKEHDEHSETSSINGDSAGASQTEDEKKEIDLVPNRLAEIKQANLAQATQADLKKYLTWLDDAEKEGHEVKAVRWNLQDEETRRIENDSRRVETLRRHAEQSQNPNAQYQLGKRYLDNSGTKKKSRAQEGWNLLQQAAQKNHPEACYEFIVLGLESGTVAQQKASAAYADALFEDDMRMAQVSLADAQKGRIHGLRGMHALEQGNTKQARASLQEAEKCGDHTYAFELGMLQYKQNDFNNARKSFANVTGDKQPIADWYKSVLSYATTKNEKEKNVLVSRMVAPLLDSSQFLLKDEDLEKFLSQKVVDRLQVDADNGSVQASYLLGYRLHKRLQGLDDDPLLAYHYFQKALAGAPDEALKVQCLKCVKEISDAGHPEVRAYLRKNHPTKEQIEIDSLLSLVKEGKQEEAAKQASECDLSTLEQEAQMDDLVAYYLGLRLLEEGTKEKNEQKITKSIPLLQRGQKIENVDARKQESIAWCELGCMAGTNIAKKRSHFKKSVELGNEKARGYLCLLCQATGDKKGAARHLEQSVRNGYAPALILKARQNLIPIEGEKGSLDEGRNILERLLADDGEMLRDVLPQERAHVYALMGVACSQQNNSPKAIEWWRKAVDAGDHTYAMTVITDYVRSGDYARAGGVLEKNKEALKEREELPVLQDFLESKKDPDNANKKKLFYFRYLHYMKSAVFMKRRGIPAGLRDHFAKNVVGDLENDAASGDKTANHLLALLHYAGDGGVVVDHSKAYEYVQRAGDQAYQVRSGLLFNGIPDGDQVILDTQQAFDTLLVGLAQERCSDFHRNGRKLLVDMLERILGEQRESSIVSNFVITGKHVNHLEKVYEAIERDKADRTPEDLYLGIMIPKILATNCFKSDRIPGLLKWYKEFTKRPLRDQAAIDAQRFASKLHEHNALKLKSGHAIGAAVDCLEKAALEGDVYSQQRLAQIFAEGITFASGDRIESNSGYAVEWAQALMNNEKATSEQKASGYFYCGLQKSIAMQQVQDESKKVLLGAQAMEFYEYAWKAGYLDVVPHYLALYREIDNKESARIFYDVACENDEVWKSDGRAFFIGHEMAQIEPKYIKNILDKLMPKLCKENVENLYGIKDTVVDCLHHYIAPILQACKSDDDAQQYGFDDLRDLKMHQTGLRMFFKKNTHFITDGVLK